ncbi:MAG: hypothetical protein IH614_12265 [Desulfuromonadales bacterium]|nr:hypothetical protein [Desulfuromonadales bacterium]
MAAGDDRILHYPERHIKRPQITNRLNMLHFRQEPILVSLRHREYGYLVTLQAMPRVCQGELLQADWLDNNGQKPRNLHQFTLEKIIIPGSSLALEYAPENAWLDDDLVQMEIPDRIKAISGRQISRHKGVAAIEARLTQNSIGFQGCLTDFSPLGMRLEVHNSQAQSLHWLDLDKPISLTLQRHQEVIFSGPVIVLRQEGDRDRQSVVVQPERDNAPRYKPKVSRTKRLAVKPSPDICFSHPLTGGSFTLPVRDIATLGVCVEESREHSVLMAGMVLPDISLNTFGSPFVTFTGQVVYRREVDGKILCGITILNIDDDDHFRLIGLVHRTEDEHAYVRLNHDPEKFFDFLFDAGFLYPSKYSTIVSQRDEFIKAYNQLYLNPNKIARCFVYLEKGQIFGHVSALKIYRHTWLNHHHAATGKRTSGLKVLRQISNFHNDSYVLGQLQMRYVVGVWRPDNSFPERFFGTFCREVADPQKCSMDQFVYLQCSVDKCLCWDDLKGPWEFTRATRSDLAEFEGFYRSGSGGLLAKAFDLTPDTFEDTTVAEQYRASGFKRERHVYALRYGLDLKALIEVQDSDTGLNLSELTNAVNLFILDTNMVTPKVLEFLQCLIAVKHQRYQYPIMLYPHSYAERYRLEQSKQYMVWILNVEFSDQYMSHLEKWCR